MGLGISLYAAYKTLAISFPTVMEAAVGRLSMERSDERLRGWAQALVANARAELVIEGLDQVPRDRACVVMSNHASHVDIPILFSFWPTRLRMVAKAELFKVPIWGRAMRQAGFVPVTRAGNRAEAEAAMAQAAEAVKQGTSIWIAPEGTRSKDGTLGKFKKGGFLLARASGAPIVPIALSGTRALLPKGKTAVNPDCKVRVIVGAPIAVEGRTLEELMADVRRFLDAHVKDAI